MKFIFSLMLVALLSVGSVYAAQQGSGVTPTDRAAFLQGQMDAQQADATGARLDAYCAGYVSVVSYGYPVECQQFWTYADIYGPTFWFPRVYIGIYHSFGRNYGHWRQYDNRRYNDQIRGREPSRHVAGRTPRAAPHNRDRGSRPSEGHGRRR